MQKTILLGLLMASGLSFGQKNKQETATTVKTTELEPVVKRVQINKPNDIYETLDQEAQFVGGIMNFRKLVVNAFDSSSIKGNAILKAEISFVIELDGSITDVQATGDNAAFNAECIRAVKNSRAICKPGKLNGEAVRSRFKMPMKMQFQ